MSPTAGLMSAVGSRGPTDSEALNITSLAVAQDIKEDTSGFNGLSSDNLDSFITETSVRSQWIAFWILWIIWALLLYIKKLKRDDETEIRQSTDERAERTETGFLERLGNGPKRASKIAHDLLLGFLSALVMNTLGRGS
ncbi:11801_t:CDS:2, partial [Gigaspora margarita]